MTAPPGRAPVPTLTPRANDGDAAKAAWLSRVARRTLRGELSKRQAAMTVRVYLAEPREHTEADFIAWLMKGQWRPKPRVRQWRVGETGWRTHS